MQEYLNDKLQNGKLNSRVLLSKARLPEVRDWVSPSIGDPKYLPFYYYLGTQIQPKNVIELGFGLGLTASALLQGCETVEKYVGYQLTVDDFYYSPRLGHSTLKEYFKGSIKIDVGDTPRFESLVNGETWDLGIISQKVEEKLLRKYMDILWLHLSETGLLIVDHLQESSRRDIFNDWCKAVSRESQVFNTRYILGIVKR